MSTVSKLKALSLVRASAAALMLALAPMGATAVAAEAASVAVSADEVLAALETARHGDLRAVDKLLAAGAVQGAARDLLEARRASAWLRVDEARAALDRYFAGKDTDTKRLFVAHDIASNMALLFGQYAEAARHAEAQLAVSEGQPEDRVDSVQQNLAIAASLAGEAAQVVEAQGNGAPVALERDKVGLLRSPITVNGMVQEAVLDTGAGVSVVSESTAKRLGLRIVGGAASVGNSVGGNVGVRLGIADRLEFGGAVVRNVVFAIMDDAALEFPVPGGYKMEAILGLPVLRAIGRVEFTLGEKALRVTPSPVAAAQDANLLVIGSVPYLKMSIAGVEFPILFDTGANATSVYPDFAALAPGLKAVEDDKKVGQAGVGGMKKIQNMLFLNVPVAIGGNSTILPKLDYRPDGSGDEDMPYGKLGIDVLSQFESFSIDYANMVLEVGRPVAVQTASR